MSVSSSRKDRFTVEQRSALMGRIKSKNTSFELEVFRALRRRGAKFRTHYAGAPGKPDIAKPRARKAVFLHSDFWHGWRLPTWEHVLTSPFWLEKIRKNRKRDQKVLRKLRREGWKVLVIWQHQIKRSPTGAVERIARFLK